MITLAVVVLLVSVSPDKVQLARGQELVYRGQCIDAVTGDDAGTRTSYELSTRLFALEADGEIAVATNITNTTGNSATRFGAFGKGLAIKEGLPLVGPATLDPILLSDLPNRQLGVGNSWSVGDNKRPPRRWTVEACEPPPDGGAQCWKLRGQQQSHNWEMADEAKAWRRDDVVWLDARTMIVQRLERVLIIRDPDRPNMLRRIVTCHQLESNIVYPGRLEADVRAEITVVRQAFDRLSEQADARVLEAQARRIATHLRTQPKTEWRHVVLTAEKQIDAARRGEIIAVAAVEESTPKWIVGRPAPDFVVEIASKPSFQLSKHRGQPVIIGVLQVAKPFGRDAIKSLEELNTLANGSATVIVVDQFRHNKRGDASLSGDRFNVDFPAKRSNPSMLVVRGWQIESLNDGPTPRFILIDEHGIIRQIIEGYGAEVPALLRQFVESSRPAKPAAPAGIDGRK